jgi:N4-gp56 family major capsid protein
MADAVTQFSTLSNDAPNVYIARRMYELAEKKLQLGQFAAKFKLEQRHSKTLRVVRYKRLNLPQTVLTEGTPPDAVALSIENVDVTVEQWGIVVLLTDVVQITTQHPALNIAIERASMAMAETLEREMAKTLLSGTNVFYGAAAANRAALDGTKKLVTSDMLAVLANLRSNGAGDFEGGLYGGVMPPQVEADILATDTSFINAQTYAGNLRPLEFGEIGVWSGTRWVRGQFLPMFRGVAAPDASAASATKGQVTAVDGGGTINSGVNFKFQVVAREITTGYERKISQPSANIASAATGNNESFTLTAPSSAAYVYDWYMTTQAGAGSGSLYLVASGKAASSATTITAGPAGTEAVAPGAPADTKEVFFVFVFGKDGFGRVELNGMSLQSYLTPAGESWSNPLAQGRKVGSKIMWKSFIIENSFLARIEVNSAYSANLPA